MANRTLSDMPPTTTPAGADILHNRQNLTDKSITMDKISEYVITNSAYSPVVTGITGTSYVIPSTSRRQIIIATISADCALTYPGSYGDGFEITIINDAASSANVTGHPNGKVTTPGEEITFFWNGTAWEERTYRPLKESMLLGTGERLDVVQNGNNPPTVKQYSRFRFVNSNDIIYDIIETSDRTFTWGSGGFPSISDGTWYLFCDGNTNSIDNNIDTGSYGASTDAPTLDEVRGGYYNSSDEKCIAEFVVASSVVTSVTPLLYNFPQKYSFPIEDGAPGEFMQTDGNGTLSFADPTVSDDVIGRLYVTGGNVTLNQSIIFGTSISQQNLGAISGLTADAWYFVVIREDTLAVSLQALSTLTPTIPATWSPTLATDQLDLETMFEITKNYTRYQVGGNWYRVLWTFYTDSTPSSIFAKMKAPSLSQNYLDTEGFNVAGQTITYTSASATTTNYLYAHSWYSKATTNIDKMLIGMAAFTGGTLGIVGIYADNGAYYPGTKIAETAELTLTTPNTRNEVIRDLIESIMLVEGKRYWLAFAFNASVSVYESEATATTNHAYAIPRVYDSTLPATFPGGAGATSRKCLMAISGQG